MKHEQILVNLRKIIRSVNLEGKRIEKEHGVSIPQLLCLNFLNGRPDFVASHKEIKDFIQLNASTVTGIVSRLEKKGLVARLPKQQDRRVGLVALTAKGSQLLQATPDPLHRQLAARLKQLSPDELQALQHAFEMIINFLDVENVEAAPILTSGTDIDAEE